MKILKWSLISVSALICIFLGIIYFIQGYDMYIVRSDSMKPEFGAGDMIITVPAQSIFGEIKTGDIVTYHAGETRVTHRVIDITENNYITQGDSNEAADARPVTAEQITGKYLMKLPYVGYAINFIQTKPGWLALIILPTVILLGLIIKDLIKEALKPDEPAKGGKATEKIS